MIEHLIINAAFIIGLSMITQPGYILHWYRSICERVPFLHKPLITCRLCMSSIYGLMYLFVVVGIHLSDWNKIPFYLLSLVFVVGILSAVSEVICKVRDYMNIRVDGLNLDMKDLFEKIKSEE
jgi:hypothetical protein